MSLRELFLMCFGALRGHRLRSSLSALGIAIGVAAVVLLTAIGEGARLHILGQFTQFGTNILEVSPGKTETIGLPFVLGGTTRKLTLEDALALERVRGVRDVCPVAMGQARVEARGRGRSVYAFGVTPELSAVWQVDVRQGSFWPDRDPRRGAPVALLGPGLKRELFGERNAIGEFVRAAGTRLRVIGVMEPKGRILGFDMDDVIYVPVATCMQMFNMDELSEIDVTYTHSSRTDEVVEAIRATLIERHRGHEDFTITTQAGMLAVFARIMDAITLAVAALAGISLLVGAIGIVTTMWISVGERTHEIGVLRAIGATAKQVHRIFLFEAMLLSGLGGLAGLAGGYGLALLGRALVPGMPVQVSSSYAAATLGVSLVAGIVSGVLPARRAARMDPIRALRAE